MYIFCQYIIRLPSDNHNNNYIPTQNIVDLLIGKNSERVSVRR